MAYALRGGMDAAEYEHVYLGFLFLKDTSDAVAERQEYLKRVIDKPEVAFSTPLLQAGDSEAGGQLPAPD